MLVAFPMETEPNPGEPEGEEDPVLAPYGELERPGSYYICGMALLPEHRGRGLGTRMLGLAREEARRRGLAEDEPHSVRAERRGQAPVRAARLSRGGPAFGRPPRAHPLHRRRAADGGRRRLTAVSFRQTAFCPCGYRIAEGSTAHFVEVGPVDGSHNARRSLGRLGDLPPRSSPNASIAAPRVRAAALLGWAPILRNVSSTGSRSGEWGGRWRTSRPPDPISSLTPSSGRHFLSEGHPHRVLPWCSV